MQKRYWISIPNRSGTGCYAAAARALGQRVFLYNRLVNTAADDTPLFK